jgi:hypothetical protein
MKYFGQWRRLVEDHEELPEVSEAMVTPAALTLTHILLGELKVIGWNLSDRFWRAPHPSKA